MKKSNQGNIEKIKELFFKEQNRTFHIREMARITKVSASSISRYVKLLLNEKFLIIKRKKPIFELQANLEAEKFIKAKKAFNIKRIENSGIIEYLTSLHNHPEAIILYGSYSRAEETKDSDVDMLIITDKKLNPNLEKFEKTLNRRVHLLEMKRSEIKKELLNNLINGIKLYGFIKID